MTSPPTSAAEPTALAVERRRIFPRRLPRGWPLLSVYLLVVGVFLVGGIFADVISPHDPTDQTLVNRLAGPGLAGRGQHGASFSAPTGWAATPSAA